RFYRSADALHVRFVGGENGYVFDDVGAARLDDVEMRDVAAGVTDCGREPSKHTRLVRQRDTNANGIRSVRGRHIHTLNVAREDPRLGTRRLAAAGSIYSTRRLTRVRRERSRPALCVGLEGMLFHVGEGSDDLCGAEAAVTAEGADGVDPA